MSYCWFPNWLLGRSSTSNTSNSAHLILETGNPAAHTDHRMPALLHSPGSDAAPLCVQVQSFLRGWLCRRKWKTIIQDYIRSPHADSMRKRNQVVFSMLEAEAEYVQQLHILVNNFLRPLRMAASSKKPPITHDDVSSIFLNRWGPSRRIPASRWAGIGIHCLPLEMGVRALISLQEGGRSSPTLWVHF